MPKDGNAPIGAGAVVDEQRLEASARDEPLQMLVIFRVLRRVFADVGVDVLRRLLMAARRVNQFMQPQFELDKAYANYAAGLQSGMRISLECTGRGDVAKTPVSKGVVPID